MTLKDGKISQNTDNNLGFVLTVKIGKDLVTVYKSIESVEMLTCQHLNGFSAPVHWTQAVPVKTVLVKILMIQLKFLGIFNKDI